MNKKDFISGLAYLGNYYNNFNFDYSNKEKVEIWYSKFKNFQIEDFQFLIKSFCEQSEWAPTSPTPILEYAKSIIISKQATAEEAWELLYEKKQNHGMNNIRILISGMPPADWPTNRQLFYKSLPTAIRDVARLIETDLINMTSESRPFVSKAFKELYSIKIKVNAAQQLTFGKEIRLAEFKGNRTDVAEISHNQTE